MSTTVTKDRVILKRQDLPYQGCDQIIEFSGNVENNDYIEFHVENSRKAWEWCKDKTSVTFSGCYTGHSISIKYFRGASSSFFSLVSSGTELMTMDYKLKNPLEDFKISEEMVEVGESVTVSYKLKVLPPFCNIIVRRNGLRLFTYSPVVVQGEYVMRCPRLPGSCEIAFVANSTGEMVLASKHINVTDQQNKSKMNIWFNGQSSENKILTVPNHQQVVVRVSGQLLIQTDRVVVVKCPSVSDILTPPKEILLQSFVASHMVGSNGTVALNMNFLRDGVFYVCLAVGDDRHAKLLGDWATLIVSDRVRSDQGSAQGSSTTSSAATSVEIPLPPPSDAESSSQPCESRFICSICFDNVVSIKFDPCKHVCVCEVCNRDLIAYRNRMCPMCRTDISSWEKVFLV